MTNPTPKTTRVNFAVKGENGVAVWDKTNGWWIVYGCLSQPLENFVDSFRAVVNARIAKVNA